MTVTVANLAIKVAAQTGEAQTGILGLAAMLGPGGAFVVAGLAAAAVVGGIGIASIKMAGDFQQSMTQLVTGAGESQKNIGMVSNAILNMATDTGTTTSQLAAGMYMIESAGYHGAAGLAILKAAAEGAKVGAADLGVVADATTTLMTDFGAQTGGASGAVNALIATVASGKTHMQDLAQSLSQVAPTAAAAHVSLKDMLGALATMTGEGVPAANAATYLRQTIIALDAPSAAATKALNSVGLTTGEVSAAMQKSLPDALKMITDAVGKKFPAGSAAYVEALKNISGGSKTMQGMLDLTGNHLAAFQNNVANVSGAMQKGGNSINGWNLVQGDFNQKMDRAREVVEVLMIRLGTQLLPVVGRLVDAFSTNAPAAIATTTAAILNIVSTGQRFISFMQGGSAGADALKVAFVILGGAILGFVASTIPPLVVAWYTEASAAAAAAVANIAAAWPFIVVGAAVALLILGIYELVKHWSSVEAIARNVGIWFINLGKTITGFLSGVWKDITTTVASWGAAFQAGIADIGKIIQTGFNSFVAFVEAPFKLIVGLFAWLYQHNTYFADLVNAIRTDLNTGKAFVLAVWADIQHIFTAAGNFIKQGAEGDWLLIERFIIQPIQRAQAVVSGVIATVEGNVQAGWANVSGATQAAWNRFTGIIASAVGIVRGDVQNIVNSVTAPITALGGTLFNAGKNLIQMLINGITSMAGAVGQAAANIAHNITSFLGFHSPTEKGPGATADKWMPALGAMLESGLTAQATRAATAANKVATAIAGGIRGVTAQPAIAGIASGNAGISGLPAGMAQANGLATATANGQPIQVSIYLDSKKVAQAVVPQMPAVLRNATGTRTF